MNVLMISHKLPTKQSPGSMAPVYRQIESLRDIGIGIRVLELEGRRKLKYAPALLKIHGMLDDIDIVHAHFGYCAWVARSQFSKPIVASFLGDDLLGTRKEGGGIAPLSKVVVQINKVMARSFQGIIVQSAQMAEVVKPSKSHIISSGIDIDLFKPMPTDEARNILGWPKDGHYVLFPNNPEIPVKAYPVAKAAVDHASQILQEPIELVPLWGITPQDVPIYMNACSTMLMVSYSEGSPNVVKEAMACNLPVISVPVGDTVELLDGVFGYRLVERDPIKVGQALAQTLQDAPAPRGREIIMERGLDIVSVAQRIKHIYSSIIY